MRMMLFQSKHIINISEQWYSGPILPYIYCRKLIQYEWSLFHFQHLSLALTRILHRDSKFSGTALLHRLLPPRLLGILALHYAKKNVCAGIGSQMKNLSTTTTFQISSSTTTLLETLSSYAIIQKNQIKHLFYNKW